MSPWRTPYDTSLSADAMTFVGAADNCAQRLPIALVLDTSSSMAGRPIANLNTALAGLADDLRRDVQLSAIAELAIITFGHGGVTAWRGDEPAPNGTPPFVPAGQLTVPRLSAGGVTPLMAAVDLTMRCVADEKARLKRRRLQYYRPHIWLFSDGQPIDGKGMVTTDWRRLAATIHRAEADGRFVFFSVIVVSLTPAGDTVLKKLTPDGHVRLEGFEFASVLRLVCATAESAARGQSAQAIKRRINRVQMPAMR
jgi:uncharacterized protein YegL